MKDKIRIIHQDAFHQYDESGRAITTWDDKKCTWIVNPEFEKYADIIDWWGKDNDFPRGETLAEYEELHPNWREMPDIVVTWTWNEEDYKKQWPDWKNYSLPQFPDTCVRSWGYINYSEKEAIEHLGKYCGFNTHATNVKITYNGKIIYDGKL